MARVARGADASPPTSQLTPAPFGLGPMPCSFSYGSVATPCWRRASTPVLNPPSWVRLLARCSFAVLELAVSPLQVRARTGAGEGWPHEGAAEPGIGGHAHMAASNGSRGHVAALDGLRGVAALTVVVRHCLGALDVSPATLERILSSPLVVFMNATGAVQLFFVLSGFVLAASLARQRDVRELPQYFVRRVFRIHPPYVCAVLAAWTASFLYTHADRLTGVSLWIEQLSRVHLDSWQLAESLLFPGNAHLQLSVGWSLEVEMVFSLVLPLLLLTATRTHWAFLLALCLLPLSFGDSGHPVLKFATDFGLGIALFLERERLERWLGGLGPGSGGAVLSASLLLFVAPHLLGWQPSPTGDPASILLMGAGAAGLTASAAFLPLAKRPLSSRPCRFLGRVSYSLYLLHYPLILLLAPALVERPLGVEDYTLLLAAVLALGLPLSELSYRCVELPAIRAGNAFGARLAGWMRVRFLASRLGGG